jgi:hypothetical protein
LSLTAPERETVITFSDEDETATVHTHQRRIITKLMNNPAAGLIERIDFANTVGAVVKIPADLISFRSGRRKLTPEQAPSCCSESRQGAASRLASILSQSLPATTCVFERLCTLRN